MDDIDKIEQVGFYEKNNNQYQFSVRGEDAFVDMTTGGLLTNSKVSTYHFELSDDFETFDPSTWTYEDLILYYCSSNGYIDSLQAIRVNGYDALSFEVIINGN